MDKLHCQSPPAAPPQKNIINKVKDKLFSGKKISAT